MSNENTAHNEVMNADEAALFLKMPKSTLLKLTSEGQIPGVKVGRGWRFNLTALENWKNASAAAMDEDSGTVGEPVDLDFDTNLSSAEDRLQSTIKPVVDQPEESIGDYDFDSVGEVRELEDEEETAPVAKAPKKAVPIPEHVSEGLGEVRELEEEPEKALRGRPRKPSAARTTSALELMARISEKSSQKPAADRVSKAKSPPATLTPKRRGRPPRQSTPAPILAPVEEAPVHKTQVRETIRETVRETSQEDAVEISRPYNPAAATKRPDFSRPSKPAGNSFSLLRKLSYWVVVLAVLALAAFGIKGLLVPATTEPEVAAPTPQLPSLPEFDTPVVYRHNDKAQPGEDNFKMPEPTPAPAPQEAPDQSLAQITSPPVPTTEPAPNQVALTPIPAQETTQPTTPISSPQPVDRGLESINRILPALFDLSGCSINSSNNEIRIVFQDGIFSSGVNIGSQGRTQLARVAEFLNANAPDFWVIIEGQTDSGKVRAKSPFRDNYTLGLRRAIEATAVMREEGNFPADRLLASSAGGLTPPFPENQPGAAARNRTVVLRLVPKTSPLPTQNQ